MTKNVLLVAGLMVSMSGFAQSKSVAGSMGDKLAVVTPLKDGRFEVWTSSYDEGICKDTVVEFPTNFVAQSSRQLMSNSPSYDSRGKVISVTTGDFGSITTYQRGNTYTTVTYIHGMGRSTTTTTFNY